MNFYILLYLVLIFATVICIECEHFSWAAVFYISIPLAYICLNKEFVTNYTFDSIKIIIFSVAYLILGIVWSLIRWILYIIDYILIFKNAKEIFIKLNKILPNDSMKLFEEWCRKNQIKLLFTYSGGNYKIAKPRAGDFVEKIIAWGCFWPIDIVGFILNYPVRKLFSFIFRNLTNSYQWLSNKLLNYEEFK